MYESLLGELQLMRTLLDGIEHMATAAIGTEPTPSSELMLAESARAIREQLQLLSDKITESLNRST